MAIALLIIGILLLIISIISPVNIFVGGGIGIILIAVGIFIKVKSNRNK